MGKTPKDERDGREVWSRDEVDGHPQVSTRKYHVGIKWAADGGLDRMLVGQRKNVEQYEWDVPVFTMRIPTIVAPQPKNNRFSAQQRARVVLVEKSVASILHDVQSKVSGASPDEILISEYGFDIFHDVRLLGGDGRFEGRYEVKCQDRYHPHYRKPWKEYEDDEYDGTERVCVEERNAKGPSGISTTDADWWVDAFPFPGGEISTVLVLPVPTVRAVSSWCDSHSYVVDRMDDVGAYKGDMGDWEGTTGICYNPRWYWVQDFEAIRKECKRLDEEDD